MPLSFPWDGEALRLATASATPTAWNLLATGAFRLGLGKLSDVMLIEGTMEAIPDTEIPDTVGDAFAVKTGLDPRREPNATPPSGSGRGGSRRGGRSRSWRAGS